ncbi:MAG: hypothetical protein JNK46_17200 [Methylobacteriaceae bacterium]|nr:hypothetical protein [Methylobacteriaceae bacterium]
MRRTLAAALICLTGGGALAQYQPPGPQRLIETPYPDALPGARRDPPTHFVRPRGQRLLPTPYPNAYGPNALDDPATLPGRTRQRLLPAPYPRLGRPGGAAPGSAPLLAQSGAPAPAAPLTRIEQIGPHVARCWTPPADPAKRAIEATLRFSIRRDGALLGPPRIVALKAGSADLREEARAAAMRAVAACAPIPVAPALGAAIAGRPILLRLKLSAAELAI